MHYSSTCMIIKKNKLIWKQVNVLQIKCKIHICYEVLFDRNSSLFIVTCRSFSRTAGSGLSSSPFVITYTKYLYVRSVRPDRPVVNGCEPRHFLIKGLRKVMEIYQPLGFEHRTTWEQKGGRKMRTNHRQDPWKGCLPNVSNPEILKIVISCWARH